MWRICPVLCLCLVVGCGGSSPSAPAPPPPPANTRVIGLSGSLDFGSVPVGSAATAVLTINNTGNSTLNVTGLSASGGLTSVLAANWLSGPVLAGSSQQVTVQFAPVAAQVYSGTISVLSDATGGVNTIQVSGTGTQVVQVPIPGYYVWGGPTYTQYLGFFTCLFCVESDPNSINNQFGQYGSQFSPTSIRNEFSQYGSSFGASSVCNQFATNPPRVFNSTASIYYGELTINTFRPDAIKTASVVNWLTTNVCAR